MKDVYLLRFSLLYFQQVKKFLGGTITMEILALLIILILFVFILTNRERKYLFEETEIKAIVTKCKKGSFTPDESYSALANSHLANKSYDLWTTYQNLANINGTYHYIVTVNIGGNNYNVIREKPYKAGQSIIITRINIHINSKLVKTIYK